MNSSPTPAPEPQNIRRLQQAILGYSALTLLVVSSVVAVVSLLPLHRDLQTKQQDNLLDALNSRVRTVAEYRDRAEQIAIQIASRTTARQQLEAYKRGELELTALQQRSRNLLLDALQSNPDVAGITRLDDQHRPVIEIGKTIPTTVQTMPLHQSQQAIVWPLVMQIDNRDYIVVYAPIVNSRRNRLGTDIVLFEANKLQQIVADFEGWGKDGQLLLGTVWQNQPKFLLTRDGDTQVDSRLKTALELAGRNAIGLLPEQPRTSTVAYSAVTGGPWVLVAQVDSQVLYAPVRQQISRIGGTAIVLILLSTGGMLLLLRPLTGRITLRAEEMAEIVRNQTTALRQHRDDLEQRVEERTAQLSQEVRDRQQAEADLQAVTERLTLALKSGDLGYWQWSSVTNELFWDDRLYDLHHLPKGDLNYSIFRATVHPDDILLMEELVGQAFEGNHHENALGRSMPYEVLYRTACPDGQPNYLKGYGTAIRDQDGAVTGMLGVCFNVTQLKRAEAQLEHSNQELKRASQIKDEFLATMSHELRTPLNVMLGMTEILREEIHGAINTQQLNTLKRIENSGFHLLELINTILDLSNIAAGKMALNLEPTDVQQLCYSSLQMVQQQAQIKAIQIQTTIPTNLPAILMDRQRIRQVLISLLNNAVKFTPESGRITFTVHPQSVADTTGLCPQGYLQITVSDTGIGVAPEDIDSLFNPFVQIDSALNRRYEGTGLGLSLVKQIIKLHGGQVAVTSEVDVGSSFIVYLPWITKTPSQSKVLAPVEPKLKNSHSANVPAILLVEDDEANIMTLSNYLGAKGYRLALARNGQEAIALLPALQPKVIIMDIQMPVMDGLEATKYIRQTLEMSDIPIIALTALAMQGDRERCLNAGATEYLSKPVKLKQLESRLNLYL
ncbi:response regulator [filamentous cyanobacterium LEGE 11480]|uniref:Circadian input-output histidine kinase CikA n=1 Tax=Romeriopsis navalis LEGE 11480 TaxID=2777977 RepID=A0A928VMW5_9CYAN|nr:ATP-binding protein [Romeriopsis navalis]MBE9029332.1 response regulator [Romeriopsis navalis LEGE 11480]